MLRPDFPDIFDYIIMHSASYSINTNGTLITPGIATQMRRKGSKMIALYGATAEIHDYITRNLGSFEATKQGMAYLREAGAGFGVQLVLMKENYRQFQNMIDFAKSFTPYWRIGASWLFFSANGDIEKNKEIMQQRLTPVRAAELDRPDLAHEDSMTKERNYQEHRYESDDQLFLSCILKRHEFHIDPFGGMTFCSFIKDPTLRYDLRKGDFTECWERFIPSLADQVRGGKEYKENCGSCTRRQHCWWCPAYAYLEHRCFSAKIEYLCAVADANSKFKAKWKARHQRCYKIADIPIQVNSDIAIKEGTFAGKFKPFEAKGPTRDQISLWHHFSLPDLRRICQGKEVYRRPPWAVLKYKDSWIYIKAERGIKQSSPKIVAVFNNNHTRADIYFPDEDAFIKGGVSSLTFPHSDHLVIARIIADRHGGLFHSSGMIMSMNGLLIIGESIHRRSELLRTLSGSAKILCDEGIIVQSHKGRLRIHGTWFNGKIEEVSPSPAPLRGMFFLAENARLPIAPIINTEEVNERLLASLIRPLVVENDWWKNELSLIEEMSLKVPSFYLRLDKADNMANTLKEALI